MNPLTPKEVRLGNLTSHGVVRHIDRDVFSTFKDGMIHYSIYKKIFPVPLTPEILEGFGFIKDDGMLCLEINKNVLDYLTAHPQNGLGLYSIYGDGILFPKLKHAHTLQNFVQAISGEELVYKPKLTT